MESKERFLKTAFIIVAALGVAAVYFSIVLGQNVNSMYYYGLISIPFFIIFAFSIYGRYIDEKASIEILREWGKKIDRKRHFDVIDKLFFYENKEKGFFIDDQTFHDLNLKEIFEMVDRTYSTPGEQTLYKILRMPLFSKTEIEKREQFISFFQKNEKLRHKVQMALYKIGRSRESYTTEILFEKLPENNPIRFLVYFMSIAPILSALTIPFLKSKAVVLILLSIIINIGLHNYIKNKISIEVSSFGRIGSIVKGALSISSLNCSEINEEYKELKEYANSCKKMAKKTSFIGRTEGLDIISDYMYNAFLIEESCFFMVINKMKKSQKKLKYLYESIGEIDALISIASFREGLNKNYSEPEFIEEGKKIKIQNMRHPLIKDAVPNSIEINESGIIITGSNMSGKSTFLRTFGVNVLFSQTICTCLCEKYEGTFFKVITSISPDDNIMGGKSYYMAEAEAILRIIKNCDGENPSLCIIDEIFRGTNPVERISAACEILDYLPEHFATAIVATHDIELADMVKHNYDCYYFTEDVGKEGLEFDYKIKKGIIKTRNAIKLLKFLGYPEEIVEGAEKRANEEIKE